MTDANLYFRPTIKGTAMRNRILGLTGALALAGAMMAGPAMAQGASCHGGMSFERWLDAFKQEAVSKGVSRQAVETALAGIRFDPNVVRRDRGQGVFQQSFLQFAGRMTGAGRHSNGVRRLKSQGRLLSAIEQKIGVPPPVVVALWGLESDYGAVKGGSFNVIQSVATLAYDCRRPDFFRRQLMGAVQIVARGDLRPNQMIGNWAGELGPTQFTPFYYFENGVDFDGDGRVDMINSTPDALASAANLLRNRGWQRGQPWLQEVRVPAQLPWREADVDIKHPRRQWVQWGVRSASGRPLPSDGMPASLLLPMGRNGPAFLAYPNFDAFTRWNASFVYALTAAYFATRLDGAPPMGKGNAPVAVLSPDQVRQLQRSLVARGFLKSGPRATDGIIGSSTRTAVKAAQIKLGLPADSYPSPELLQKLQGR